MIVFPEILSSVALGITLACASFRDIRERRVPFRTWYPMLVVLIPSAIWLYLSLLWNYPPSITIGYLFLVTVFCGLFYLSSAYLHLFGGADAWAMIFITFSMPLFPVEPFFGFSPLGFFPLTVLINAVLFNLVTPLGILAYNLRKGNRAPLRYLLVGYPVNGEDIMNHFGFVMEDFWEDEGVLKRRYITFKEAIMRMFSGEKRMYTGDLRRNPDKYTEEIALYNRAGRVWLSYGVPFIVPIFAGFISAIVIGDVLFAFMQFLTGVI